MQNLLEIQNALRSAPDQQLMALMQGANPTVPQWAVASELNNRKEMRMEQTRQEGLGQPTVLAQLTGAASAPTPQTNVAGMPQGVASGMAQSMAPKTNVNQNTGINTVARNANAAAPVATMASGGILKMQSGGDPAEKTYTFIYPEGMNTPPFELGISDLDEYDAVIKAIRKLGGTIVETDTGRVMQSDTAKKILQESSDVAEADARVPKYVPSASDLYDTDSGRFKSENATPENYVVSAGLPPAGGAMYSSPTGGQGGSADSSLLGLPADEFSQTPLSTISTPKGLATLAAAGDADMRDETPVVDTTFLTETQRRIKESDAKRARAAFLKSLAPNNAQGQPGGTVGGFRGLDALISRSPNSGELTPTQTARNQEMLEDTLKRERIAQQRQDSIEKREIAQDAADTRKAFSVPLESDAVETISTGEVKPNPFAVNKAPFNATSDEAAKKSVSQATLANNARDERVARVTSDEPGTELAETVGRIAPKADEPQQLRFINDILNRGAGEAAVDVAEVTTDPYAEDVVANNRIRFMPNEAVGGGVEAQDLSNYPAPKTNAEKTTTPKTNAEKTTILPTTTGNDALDRRLGLGKYSNPYRNPILDDVLTQAADTKVDKTATPYQDAVDIFTGKAADSLNTDGPFMPKEDTRITRMKVLADQISSGKLTPTALEFAKKDLERLRAAVERTGGQDTIEKYFSNQIIGPALRGAEKYGVKGIDFAVNNLGIGNLISQAGGPRLAGAISDYTSENAKLADDMQIVADTSPAEIQSNAILDAMITNDAQTKAGSAANVDNSLGALITDGKAQTEAVPGQILTPELNDKLAAGLETVVQDRTKEISKDGALINKMWGESEFQPETNVESQIVNAKGLTAAEQLDADRAAGLTAGENAFVASTKQDAGGSGKNKPTGIATINPMANRASDSPSSYEQKLLDILAEREKSADQDKWLGLAEMGMRLMASSNPNMLSAIGEAGLGASQTFLGNKRKAEAQEMDILTKLSALESRKQIADDANRTRLTAAGIAAGARSGKPAAGSYASVNQALSGIRAQISAIEGNMPAQPPTESRALDAYNTQIATLRSLREQEQQLMATNPVVASIFANVDGANEPAAVNLSK